MTGVITSLPPLIEQPPGNNASNPAGLPGVTYVVAFPNIPQTWTALQTFLSGNIEFTGSVSGNTFLNASAIASGTLTLPAATDTLVARNTVDTLINKSIDGLTNTLTNIPTGSLDADLQAIAALTGSGILSRTGTNTWALRTLTGTANEITVTNGDGVSGNETLSLPAALTFTGKTITGGTFNVGVLTATTVNGATISGAGTLTLTGSLTVNAGNIAIGAGTAGQVAVWNAGNLSGSATPTLGASGTLGSITFGNATSGLLTLQAVAGALGSITVSVPAAGGDTLIGKATTDTLTNKTYDTAGAGNSFKINGNAITSNTGTGAVNVLQTSPSLITPALGVATATTLNGNTFTTGTYTLTGTAAKTLTFSNSLTLSGTDATTMTFPTTNATVARTDAAQTFTGVQTFSTPIAKASGGTGNTAESWQFIEALTASASPTLTTSVFTSAFDDYAFVMDNIVPVTDNVGFNVTVESGGTFQSTAYLNSVATTTSIDISTVNTISNVAGKGITGQFVLHNVNSTTVNKVGEGRGGFLVSGGTVFSAAGMGGFWNGGQGAVTRARFQMTSGNISTGVIKVFGIRNN